MLANGQAHRVWLVNVPDRCPSGGEGHIGHRRQEFMQGVVRLELVAITGWHHCEPVLTAWV